MDSSDPGLTLAQHYLDVGRPQSALEALGQLAEAQAESAEAWRLRSAALFHLERYFDASQAATRGLAQRPESTVLLWLLGLSEAEQDRLAEAERAVAAALDLEPEQPGLLALYANIAARGGQTARGRWLVWEAERLDPEDPRVLRTASLIAWIQGHEEAAAQYNSRLLALDPEDVAGRSMRGTLLAGRGDVRGARQSFEAAASLDPSNRSVAAATRESRIATHPLLWPVWPFERFGPFLPLVAGWGIALALIASGLKTAGGLVLLAYFLLVVYSWTLGPLAARWLRSRRP